MRHHVVALAACAASLLCPAVAARAAGAQVSVDQAWSRATAGAEMPGAIFVTIHGGAAADQLVGVTTPVATDAMLHRMDMGGGMMRMEMVSSLPVPARGTVTLDPAGAHIMLTGLSKALHQGEAFPATFRFRQSGNVTATVHVAGPGASAPPVSR